MAEEAVALARMRGEPRAEGVALISLGFFQLWVGEFATALLALDQAEDAFAEVTDPCGRQELPLCCGARGVLWALRGDDSRAEAEFAQALSAARLIGDGCYEAIVRALRAEFTAHLNPRRARHDANWALSELRRRRGSRWQSWAVQAAGVAAREAGMAAAAEVSLRAALISAQTPTERARSQLLLAETLLRHGDAEGTAASAFRQAAAVFETAGCRYWAIRSYQGLANIDASAQAPLALSRQGDLSDLAYRRLLAGGEQLSLTAFGVGAVYRSGRPVVFHSHNAERALFMLALPGAHGIHTEQLAEQLWPEAAADRTRILGRLRTLLWDMRKGLGPHAWRLQRQGPHLSFDTTSVPVDLIELRSRARATLAGADQTAAAVLADLLRRPLLTRWAYEDWVLSEDAQNQALADKLQRLI